MKRITSCSLALMTGGLAASSVCAGELIQWHTNSLTYLYGKNYKVDPPIQQTFTFEHASAWSVGDLFLFIDQINFNGKGANDGRDNRTHYGEFSPRLSFGKISGTNIALGPVTDILVSMTYEFGKGDTEAYLIGPAIDLAIPGFDFFQLNTYLRKTDGGRPGDNVWQITPAWSYTIPMGRSDLVIDGYIDWVVDNDKNSRGEYHANVHINPQIKYDMGKALGWREKVYVGIEYDYWKNKFGIKDGGYVSEQFVGTTDQNTASLLLKAHF